MSVRNDALRSSQPRRNLPHSKSEYVRRARVSGKHGLKTRVSKATRDSISMSRRLLILGLVAAYSLVLHWVYEEVISPAFFYLGLRYRDPSTLPYILAFAMVALLAALLPIRLRVASDFVVWILFVMTAIPSVLIPQYADILSREESLILAFHVAACFSLVLLLAHRGPNNLLPRLVIPPSLVWTGLALATAASYTYLLYTTGLALRFVSLTSVRELRFDYRDQVASTGPALGYVVRIQGNVLNPAIIALALSARRYWILALAAIGQLLIFSVTGYKLTILSVPAILAVAVMLRAGRRTSGAAILAGVLASTGLALLVDKLQGGLVYTEIFVDRLLLTPGVLTAAHVLVFQDIPKAHWGHSFMAPFVDYAYPVTPSYLVGAEFTGSEATTANANFFADGYANLGYAGMYLEAVVLVAILWFINSCSLHLRLSTASLILLIPTLALVNSSVFTSILSNGFLAAFVVMLCLPASDDSPISGTQLDRRPSGIAASSAKR